MFGLSRGRHESAARKRGRAAVFDYRTRAGLQRATIGVLSSRATSQDAKYELVEKGSNGHRRLHQAAQRCQIGPILRAFPAQTLNAGGSFLVG